MPNAISNMSKFFMLTTTVFFGHICYSQDGVFDNYDFNSGAYHMQGIYLRQHPAPNVADTISDFYLTDIPSLNWCKSNWQFTDSVDRYINTYTYRIDIISTDDKQSLQTVWVNLIHNAIWTDQGVFGFESHLLLDLREHLLPLGSSEYEFSSLKNGRDSLAYIVRNDTVVSYFARWEKYDGKFSVKIPYTQEQLSTEAVKLNVEKELLTQLPDEEFDLTYITSLDFSDYAARVFEVQSSYNLFMAYKEDKSDWEPFKPVVYLRTK